MAITWPESVEQIPLRDGFSISYEPNLIQSPTETGPGKTRPRQSHAQYTVTPSVNASKAQKQTLQLFFQDTTAFGSIPFGWPELDNLIDDGQTHTYRMTKPPQFEPVGSNWTASLTLKAW